MTRRPDIGSPAVKVAAGDDAEEKVREVYAAKATIPPQIAAAIDLPRDADGRFAAGGTVVTNRKERQLEWPRTSTFPLPPNGLPRSKQSERKPSRTSRGPAIPRPRAAAQAVQQDRGP